MHGNVRTGNIIHSARTVGDGAGLTVTVAQLLSHMVPQRIGRPCTRYRSAALLPVATSRRAIAACNVARYSES